MSDLLLGIERDADGGITLTSPGVGVLFQRWLPGQRVVPGMVLGALSTLGREQTLIVPDGVRGVVTGLPSGARDVVVAYGDALVQLGDALDEVGEEVHADAEGATSNGTLVFRSSSSGRFYLRPAPDKPAFVTVGDEIEDGQTIFLLEVMKTFSRVTYGGPGLPTRAKIVRIAVEDGDDLEAGQVVLELEDIDS